MIDSFDRPTRSAFCALVITLGLASTVCAQQTDEENRIVNVAAQKSRVLQMDPTASLVRMAPKILICDPIPINKSLTPEHISRLRESSFGFVVSYQDDQVSDWLPAPLPADTLPADTLPVPSLRNELPAPRTLEVEAETLEGAPATPAPESLLPPPAPLRTPLQGVPSTAAQIGSGGWLDIRPREIDGDGAIVPTDQLPEDTSELAPEETIASLVGLHHADLQLTDIWSGASFCHRPLYFEDARLERYGCISGPLDRWPSVHSAIHFGWKTGVLPIRMAMERPRSCVKSGYKAEPMTRLFK